MEWRSRHIPKDKACMAINLVWTLPFSVYTFKYFFYHKMQLWSFPQWISTSQKFSWSFIFSNILFGQKHKGLQMLESWTQSISGKHEQVLIRNMTCLSADAACSLEIFQNLWSCMDELFSNLKHQIMLIQCTPVVWHLQLKEIVIVLSIHFRCHLMEVSRSWSPDLMSTSVIFRTPFTPSHRPPPIWSPIYQLRPPCMAR